MRLRGRAKERASVTISSLDLGAAAQGSPNSEPPLSSPNSPAELCLVAFNIWKNSRSYVTQHILFEALKKRERGGGKHFLKALILGKLWKGLGLKHLLHVNKSSLWFGVDTAVILLWPNAPGEEGHVAALGGEAGPPRAADRRAQPARAPCHRPATEAFVSF